MASVFSDAGVLADEAAVAALRELRNAGGDKQYIRCTFSYGTADKLMDAGFATIDDCPMREAKLRITIKGRIAIAERG